MYFQTVYVYVLHCQRLLLQNRKAVIKYWVKSYKIANILSFFKLQNYQTRTLAPMSLLCLIQLILFLSELRSPSFTSWLPHLIVFLPFYQNISPRNFHSSKSVFTLPQLDIQTFSSVQFPLDGPMGEEKVSNA